MPSSDDPTIRSLADVATLALEEAGRQGASQCECDASVSQGLSVSVRLGEVDTLEYQRDRGLGVTVYFGRRKGAASTADLSPGVLQSPARFADYAADAMFATLPPVTAPAVAKAR